MNLYNIMLLISEISQLKKNTIYKVLFNLDAMSRIGKSIEKVD